MVDCKNINYSRIFCCLIFFGVILLQSCGVKNYPRNSPYVYSSTVQLKANLPNEEKKQIEYDLNNYFDDSLKVSAQSTLGIFKKKLSPPAFDSANIFRSQMLMKSYLETLGFYQPKFDTFTISFDTTIHKYHHDFLRKISFIGKDTVAYNGKRHFFFYKLFNGINYPHKEIQTSLNMVVSAGIQTKIDSITYDSLRPDLRTLALANTKGSFVKKGDGYSRQITIKELDRLTNIYNNNGYFKLSRRSLAAIADTVDLSLINLDDDPIEQIKKAQYRKLHPTVSLAFINRRNFDSTYFLKYTLGNINFYPEAFGDRSVEAIKKDSSYKKITQDGINYYMKDNLFRTQALNRINTLDPGKYYNAQDYFNTINAFTQTGAWQQSDVRDTTYIDSIPKVDLDIFLFPEKRFSQKLDAELSSDVNKNASTLLSGSFVGTSLVYNFLNRNFLKSAVQWNTTARAGAEITNGDQGGIFQYKQFAIGTSFIIPRILPPFKNVIGNVNQGRTSINGNYNFTDRKDFFNLQNFNFSVGFEWKKKRDSKYTWTFKPINFELVKIHGTDSLTKEQARNPFLGFAFNKGLVLSMLGSVKRDFNFPNHPNYFSSIRANLEVSPLSGEVLKTEVFSFAKFDFTFNHSRHFKKHDFAFRVTGGIGENFKNNDSTLPFFRQFLAGGPNSMRAWRLRQLGLGSSLERDTATSNFKDRLGDIYLEMNGEYRFNMFKMLSFPVRGALFLDAGNIWNRKPIYSNNNYNGGDLNFKNFFHDLAIDAGYGVRIDFGYFILRTDIAFKMKDPVRVGDGWIKHLEWKSPDRLGLVENSNVALQIGIDYPF